MRFRLTRNVYVNIKTEFTHDTAPEWLTSERNVPGSTMDYRWFFRDHVLTLAVGAKVETDFSVIERIE